MNKKRLFIAVDINESIRDTLRERVYKSENLGKLSWVRPENYHLTLKFLGSVPVDDIEKIASAMEKSVNGIKRTTLTYTEMGVFPNPSRPRVLWAGFKESSDTLSKVAENLEEGLFTELGIEKDKRKFKPHLTVARIKGHVSKSKLADFLKREIDFSNNSFVVSSIVLYESELKKSGAEYTKIKEVALV